jgi:conjugal transfer/entry exclusion protein
MSDMEISYQTTISILQQRLKNVEELKNKIQKNLDYSLEKIKKLKNEKKETENLINSIGFPIRTSKHFCRMNNEEKIDTNNKLGNFQNFSYNLF